jgi:hypothetical protein
MNIQATNNFLYLQTIYEQPYFVVNYFLDLDVISVPVNCFMFANKNSYETGNSYLQSFGLDVSNEIIFNNELVVDKVIEFLQTISIDTNFIKV